MPRGKALKSVENLPDHVTNSWDDWVPQDRVRKFTDENKELASQLHNQMKQLQQKAPKATGKKLSGRGANGSDFSSARGSEERHASVAAQSGRGPRRHNRDFDLETVSTPRPPFVISSTRGRDCGLAVEVRRICGPKE